MRRDEAYLTDIQTAGRRVMMKTEGMSLEQFEADEDMQDIVIRQIGIMGEAARNLSDNFKELHWQVPWHEITGMRNRLVHDYTQIDFNKIWKTVKEDIPKLIQQIDDLLAE